MVPSRRGLILVLAVIALACPAQAQLPEIERASAAEILADVRVRGADVTIVNVWATWCIPCREVMPALVRIEKEFGARGVRLLFVSADFPEDIPDARRFLAERGVTSTSFMSSGTNQAFINAINAEWSGALPATALYAADGSLVDFWEGRRSYEQIGERLRLALESIGEDDTQEDEIRP